MDARSLTIPLAVLVMACDPPAGTPTPPEATLTPAASTAQATLPPTAPEATDGPTAAATQPPPAPTPSPTATAPEPTEALPVTWYRDVEPLVARTCQRCHVEGGVAPRPFTTYEDTAPLASIMAAYVGARLMPPPAPDPACAPYEGSERMVLSEAERQVFADWAGAGAPAGHPSTSPGAPSPPAALADPDLVLYPAVGHAPSFDAGGNDYHCFVLETGLTEDTFITGFDALPDRADVVHHMVLFKDKNGDAGASQGSPADGFRCYDMEGDWQFVAAWAPGAGPLLFDGEVGLPLAATDQLVLQMHYYRSTPGAGLDADKSGYALKTARRVRRELQMVEFGPTNFTIPAGEASHQIVYAWTAPEDFEVGLDIYAVGPHMHLLGTSYRGWLTHPGGDEECVVASDGWDFSNQGVYRLGRPAQVRPGDTITWSCTWDNSVANPNQLNFPPIDVGYGLGTDDEMCFVFSYSAIVPLAP